MRSQGLCSVRTPFGTSGHLRAPPSTPSSVATDSFLARELSDAARIAPALWTNCVPGRIGDAVGHLTQRPGCSERRRGSPVCARDAARFQRRTPICMLPRLSGGPASVTTADEQRSIAFIGGTGPEGIGLALRFAAAGVPVDHRVARWHPGRGRRGVDPGRGSRRAGARLREPRGRSPCRTGRPYLPLRRARRLPRNRARPAGRQARDRRRRPADPAGRVLRAAAGPRGRLRRRADPTRGARRARGERLQEPFGGKASQALRNPSRATSCSAARTPPPGPRSRSWCPCSPGCARSTPGDRQRALPRGDHGAAAEPEPPLQVALVDRDPSGWRTDRQTVARLTARRGSRPQGRRARQSAHGSYVPKLHTFPSGSRQP